jgi:hypothetical protein
MVWTIVRIALVVYVLLAVVLFGCQKKLVFQPRRALLATPEDAGLPFDDVSFQADDGVRLHGWFVPADPPRGVALFCHGNAGNVSYRLETMAFHRRLGLSSFHFDYRGYGQSEGRPSEEGTYRDAAAAWRYLTEERGVTPESIVVHGRSLGGSIAAWLAKEHSPRTLIVESTFTSVPDLAAGMYPFLPVRLLARIHYPAKEYIAEAQCPVLVVHGRADELIPFEHGRALFEAAPEPKAFLEIHGGHNEGWAGSMEVYAGGVNAFLTEHLDGRAQTEEADE